MTKPFQAGAPILKDSRKLTNEDVSTVMDMIRTTTNEHILVTTGLIKIAELGRNIQSALTKNDAERTVLLTGSRRMLRSSTLSDAGFNIGYALGSLGSAGWGTHLALSGKLIPDSQDPLNRVYSPQEIERLKV